MAVKPTTKKASASTEVVLGQAAQQITKAVNELNSATSTLNELTSKAEELTLQVANKEEAIAELEVQYAEKARQLDVDLDLNFKANSEKVATEYFKSIGKVAILSTELSALQKELTDVKANADAETKRQVASALSALKSQYDNDIKLIQSENNNKTIENSAKIAVLMEKNAFLEDQNTKLFNQIDQERTAGVARAQAGAIGNINLGDTNRK